MRIPAVSNALVWPPTLLELDRVGLNLIKLKVSPNSSQVFYRLAPSANFRQVGMFLLGERAVVVRHAMNDFLASWLDLALPFGYLLMQVLIM